MASIYPVYYAVYVHGRQQGQAVTYNPSTGAWTVTAAASGVVSINVADPDQTLLSINGYPSLFVWNATGQVGCSAITQNVVLGTWPRLDFYRQTDSAPQKFASLSQHGLLSVRRVDEKTAPAGSDRMYILGNANCSIGMDGLLAPGIDQLVLLQDQDSKYLLDASGKFLSGR
jgi:hypothetical protein